MDVFCILEKSFLMKHKNKYMLSFSLIKKKNNLQLLMYLQSTQAYLNIYSTKLPSLATNCYICGSSLILLNIFFCSDRLMPWKKTCCKFHLSFFHLPTVHKFIIPINPIISYDTRLGMQRGAVERWQPTGLNTSLPTMPELLTTAGYRNYLVGKWCVAPFFLSV